MAHALEGWHDLVLLDVMLPGVDGCEFLHELRCRSNVPVIMLTARTSQAERITFRIRCRRFSSCYSEHQMGDRCPRRTQVKFV